MKVVVMAKPKDPNKKSERKAYEAPRIVEEQVFEREALIAACREPFACGLPIKTFS